MDEALAVIALERAPGIHLNAQDIVIVDKGYVPDHATEAQHANEQVEQELLARPMLAVRAKHRGVARDDHGKREKDDAVQAVRRELEHVAGANGRGGRDGGEVAGLDGLRLEEDDEVLSDADREEHEGGDGGRGAAPLEQVEHA